jgi:hypothetical protein
MSKWIQRGLWAAIVIVVALMVKDCLTPLVPHKPTGNERLEDNQAAKVIVSPNGDLSRTVRKIKKDGTTEQVTYRDTGGRDTEVIVNNDGSFRVTQRTSGFIFEPGVGVGFDGKPLFCLDTQFYFIRNVGLVGGVAMPMDSFRSDGLRLYVAGSYRLPFKAFRNTNVYAGYNTKNEIQVGARVRF